MRRPFKIALWMTVALVVLLITGAITAIFVVRSDWFYEKVKHRIISELERSTGGTATIGSFRFDWKLLRAEVRDLIIHGKEPSTVPPLLRSRRVQVDLKIVSIFKRDIDLSALVVEEPAVHILVNPDGSTNIPAPKVKRSTDRTAVETILELAIGRFSIERGTLLYSSKTIPLAAKGENLRAHFTYDPLAVRYNGTIAVEPLHVEYGKLAPVALRVDAALAMEKNRIEVSRAQIDMQQSKIETAGTIENLVSPVATFRFDANLSVEQFARLFKLAAVRAGTVDVKGGLATFRGPSNYSITGNVAGRDLAIRTDSVNLTGARGTAKLIVTPKQIKLDDLQATALGGQFRGEFEIADLDSYRVDGNLHGFSIQQTLTLVGSKTRSAWSATASGPVHVRGRATGLLKAEARLQVTPAGGGIPVQGFLDVQYDAPRRTLHLAKSFLSTPSSRVDLSGAVGTELRVSLRSTNLDDFLPAINLVSTQPVQSLPVRLENGAAAFEGTVTGKLESPQVAGRISLEKFVAEGQRLDRLTADVTLDRSLARVANGVLVKDTTQAQFEGTAELRDWKAEPAGTLAATASIRGGDIADLLHMAGREETPVSGLLTASARFSGTIGDPRVEADVTVTKGKAYDEPFDRLQAKVIYTDRLLEVREGSAAAGQARVTANASFEHAPKDFHNGRMRFDIATNDVALERLHTMQEQRPGVTGTVRVKASGAATVNNAGAANQQILLASLDGTVATRGIQLDKRPVGDISLVAATQGDRLSLRVESDFLNSAVRGGGEWRLQPGYPGQAEITFSKVSFRTIQNWFATPENRDRFHVDGSAEGKISIAGPALDPRALKATMEITKLELFPSGDAGLPAPRDRITLRNEGPIVIALERSVARITGAKLLGPSTNLEVGGTVSLEPKGAMDVRVTGGLNLIALQDFVRGLESGGAVAINANIRGSLQKPQAHGQIELKGATFNMADIPNGLANANGVIVFNGDHATIRELKADSGGGRISATGFLGLGDASSFRIELTASQVRVRYPEGVSTTANATLTLSGNLRRSELNGTVTVLRTGFNPRTDFSSILASSADPVRTPSAARTGPLSGLNFDVRIETSPNITFESGLAHDIQAEASLRLRGTAYNPSLLGRIVITQGELNFFGTNYAINQGSISFVNPVKIEPILNLDLETKVRGIDVILTLSGPINKLNVTHRADPPMEFSEVVALLATGKAPSSDPTMAARQSAQPQSFTQLGASALIGQAIANPLSSRLQRFFGVSRLKIDPSLTGVENNPQARLTLEQQISRNLTFTYITDLTRSNQQIVRVEWTLNRQWSVLAVREENGLFGVDFLYKKSFK